MIYKHILAFIQPSIVQRQKIEIKLSFFPIFKNKL